VEAGLPGMTRYERGRLLRELTHRRERLVRRSERAAVNANANAASDQDVGPSPDPSCGEG